MSIIYLLAQSAEAVEYAYCFSAQGVRHLHECLGNDTKQYNGEVPVMLELWEMQSTLSLPSLERPLWPEMVALDWVQSMGQIDLFDHLTVSKQMTNV